MLVGKLSNKFMGLDEELRMALASLVMNDNRSVNQLERLKLLQSDRYYHEVMKFAKDSFRDSRYDWHKICFPGRDS